MNAIVFLMVDSILWLGVFSSWLLRNSTNVGVIVIVNRVFRSPNSDGRPDFFAITHRP